MLKFENMCNYFWYHGWVQMFNCKLTVYNSLKQNHSKICFQLKIKNKEDLFNCLLGGNSKIIIKIFKIIIFMSRALFSRTFKPYWNFVNYLIFTLMTVIFCHHEWNKLLESRKLWFCLALLNVMFPNLKSTGNLFFKHTQFDVST